MGTEISGSTTRQGESKANFGRHRSSVRLLGDVLGNAGADFQTVFQLCLHSLAFDDSLRAVDLSNGPVMTQKPL